MTLRLESPRDTMSDGRPSGVLQFGEFMLDVAAYELRRRGRPIRLWARSADPARAKFDAVFRNFLAYVDTFILHFCTRRYLCRPAERYHITDFSKGAMLVDRAGLARLQRYDRWYSLLQEEIDLVATPHAGIVAVGNVGAEHLARQGFPRPVTRVIHYSGLGGTEAHSELDDA